MVSMIEVVVAVVSWAEVFCDDVFVDEVGACVVEA